MLNWFFATSLVVVGALGFSALQPRADNLWVAVLHSASIAPVGTLVEGRWWFDTSEDQDQHNRLFESIGRSPAQWLPFGRAVPDVWSAHLVDGRVIPIRTTGPLHAGSDFGVDLVIAIDPKTASNTESGWPDVQGVAVAGNVTVGFFTDLEKAAAEEIRRIFGSALVSAERAEIAARASAPDASVERKAARLSPPDLAAMPFEIETARTAALRDGTRVYLIEGSRRLSSRDDECTNTHSGITVQRDGKGAFTQLGSWSYLVCNELHVDHVPLAWIARAGQTCWVTEHIYEDGVNFTLNTQEHPESEGVCAIK